VQKAPDFANASVKQLVGILKRPEYRYRYWAKRELRDSDPKAVKKELDGFVKRLNPKDPRFRHHQVEAIWGYRNVGLVNSKLLLEVLNCDNHHARAAATRQLRYWHGDLKNGDAELARRANDSNGLVRMEAALAATYVGTPAALGAVVQTTKHPASKQLEYAIATAFGAENIARHWRDNAAMKAKHPEIDSFMAKFRKNAKRNSGLTLRGAPDSAFDNQKGLQTVTISCVPERMLFTVKRFEVQAGKPVKLIFTNPDVTQHNLVIVKPGAAMEIGMAGNMMATQKDGIKKHFVPKSDKILHHTKLLNQDTAEVLRFKAPTTPGEYPYLCTFPGHWVIMRGIMVVK